MHVPETENLQLYEIHIKQLRANSLNARIPPSMLWVWEVKIFYFDVYRFVYILNKPRGKNSLLFTTSTKKVSREYIPFQCSPKICSLSDCSLSIASLTQPFHQSNPLEASYESVNHGLMIDNKKKESNGNKLIKSNEESFGRCQCFYLFFLLLILEPPLSSLDFSIHLSGIENRQYFISTSNLPYKKFILV